MSNRRWENALCRTLPPEMWFPDKNTPAEEREITKAICGRCPMQRECLDYALADPTLDGIWGGTDPKDRRKLRVSAA